MHAGIMPYYSFDGELKVKADESLALPTHAAAERERYGLMVRLFTIA